MQFVNNIMYNLLARIQDAREEAGQTLVEYGLILALISIVAIIALGTIGTNVKSSSTASVPASTSTRQHVGHTYSRLKSAPDLTAGALFFCSSTENAENALLKS